MKFLFHSAVTHKSGYITHIHLTPSDTSLFYISTTEKNMEKIKFFHIVEITRQYLSKLVTFLQELHQHRHNAALLLPIWMFVFSNLIPETKHPN